MLDITTINPRRVFSVATMVLALAGIGIVILNAMATSNMGIKQLSLARSLWKFEPANAKIAIVRQQKLSWYKLLLAGMMIASLAVSVLVRFLPAISSILMGLMLWSLWTAYLWYYWYSYVMADEKKETVTNDKSPVTTETEETISWNQRIKDEIKDEDKRLPVTIITGFLGSGKTTLVKRILNNTVGMKVLVIENEIGNEGIDHDLLMQHTAKEEIVLMNNGCICCNVRSDLLSTFRKMFSNEAFALLDWIVIETTGLADPAPLIQSFYMDRECQQKLRLDCVLTVVDSKHAPLHLAQYEHDRIAKTASKSGAHGGIPETVLQISFADKILLNKTDLVTPKDLTKLKSQITALNPYVSVISCQYAHVDIRELLNVKAFDPKRFSSVFQLQHDDSAGSSSSNRPILIQRDAQGKILKKNVRVDFSDNSNKKNINKQDLKAPEIRTISLVSDEAVDLDLFNMWISQILQKQGPNIYRLKGILHMQGYEEQFVCHGVHMIFEGIRSVPWNVPPSERRTKLVVIGKDLNTEQWEQEFVSILCK
jgi:G3E family GTPase